MAVCESINQRLSTLIHHRSQQINNSRSCMERILTIDLPLHSNKVFGYWSIIKSKIIFSDGAHFQLNGCINKQNCWIWRNENPSAVHTRTSPSSDCMVWILGWRNHRPVFLRKWSWLCNDVNGFRYCNVICEIVEVNHTIWKLSKMI